MGGGLRNYDLKELNTSDVSYKIISRGWMDLCNPTAGFDSRTANTRVAMDGKTATTFGPSDPCTLGPDCDLPLPRPGLKTAPSPQGSAKP